MLKKAGAMLLASGVLLAAGCGPKPAPPTINESMTQVMQPETQTIWDITSRAFNDRGDGLDPSKLTADDWAKLEQSAQKVADRAKVLGANAKRLTVVGPGATILGQDASHAGVKHTWDAASPQQVKALIAADPSGFAQHAHTLAQAMTDLAKAAKARNANGVYKVSSNLDEDCDGCHQPFWGTDDPPPFPKGK